MHINSKEKICVCCPSHLGECSTQYLYSYSFMEMFPTESKCCQKIILNDLAQNSYIWIFFNLKHLNKNVYYIYFFHFFGPKIYLWPTVYYMGGGVLSQKWALKCLKMVISNTFSGKTFAKVHENQTPRTPSQTAFSRHIIDEVRFCFRVDNFSGFFFNSLCLEIIFFDIFCCQIEFQNSSAK